MRQVFEYTSRDNTVTYKVRYKIDGRSSSMTFPTPEGAQEFNELIGKWGVRRALEFIKQPTEPRRIASGPTVAQCVCDYIALKPNRGTRDSYTGWYNSSIDAELGHMRINQLVSGDIQRWINSQGGSTGTIRRNHKLLSAALNDAVKRGVIKANPAAGAKIPRRLRNQSRAALTPPFTREEYELIHKSMHPHYQLLVEFLAETGCRFGEAAALTPADVNLARGTVHFNKSYSWQPGTNYTLGNTKTEESDRMIRVGTLLERLDLSGAYVFTTRGGERVKGNAFRAHHWKRALAALPAHRHGHPHDLRHAHATWLLDAGVPLHAIQKRLGHRNVMTTLQMYGHAATDAEDKILAALESL